MPVSWQMGPSSSAAISMFERMMFNEGDPGTLVTDGMVALSAAAPDQAEITGRLLNSMGQGMPNARVTLTDTAGETRSVMSNGFGAYRFGALTVGQTYTYRFLPALAPQTPIRLIVREGGMPPGLELLQGFFETFEHPARFDIIEAGFILEHVDDPAVVLKRLHQFLAPGGRIFIAVPNARSLHRLLQLEAY